MARRRWLTFDAETDPFAHGNYPVDFAWGAFDGRDFHCWWKEKEAFEEWLCAQRAIAYAHNGGRFDFHFLSHRLGGSIQMIGNRFARVGCGDAELRDSWCVAPLPLAAFDKGTMHMSDAERTAFYAKFEPEVRDRHRDEITTYLERDCRSLHALLEAFHEEHPGFPLTVPGAGLAALKRIQKIAIPTGNEGFDRDFRGYYYGGRVEALRSGVFRPRGGATVVDINSAYPCAMLERHWWGNAFWTGTQLPEDPGEFDRCMVSLVGVSRGALPVREPGLPLAYPRDGMERTFHVTGHEVRAGLETGTLRITRILEVREPCETLSFGEFVHHYWAQKEAAERAGDEARRHVAKITLNGVYGKFAQNPAEFCDYRFVDEGAEWGDWDNPAHRRAEIGGRRILGTPTLRPRWYNVATAASITGAVRAKLWRAMCASTDVYYCDTDSLIARIPRVEMGPALGQWKHEADVSELSIAGRKLYAATLKRGTYSASKFPEGVKLATKGCKLTASEVREVARGGVVEWHSPAPTYSPRLGAHFISRKIRATGTASKKGIRK